MQPVRVVIKVLGMYVLLWGRFTQHILRSTAGALRDTGCLSFLPRRMLG